MDRADHAARARREQRSKPYTDLAMTPVTDDETETLEMFTHNEARATPSSINARSMR